MMPTPSSPDDQEELVLWYWRRTRRLTFALLLLWFAFNLGAAVPREAMDEPSAHRIHALDVMDVDGFGAAAKLGKPL